MGKIRHLTEDDTNMTNTTGPPSDSMRTSHFTAAEKLCLLDESNVERAFYFMILNSVNLSEM